MVVMAAANIVKHFFFNLTPGKAIVNRTDLRVLRPNKSLTQFKQVVGSQELVPKLKN